MRSTTKTPRVPIAAQRRGGGVAARGARAAAGDAAGPGISVLDRQSLSRIASPRCTGASSKPDISKAPWHRIPLGRYDRLRALADDQRKARSWSARSATMLVPVLTLLAASSPLHSRRPSRPKVRTTASRFRCSIPPPPTQHLSPIPH